MPHFALVQVPATAQVILVALTVGVMDKVYPPTSATPVTLMAAVAAVRVNAPPNFGVGKVTPIFAAVSHAVTSPLLFCVHSAIASLIGSIATIFSCHLERVT